MDQSRRINKSAGYFCCPIFVLGILLLVGQTVALVISDVPEALGNDKDPVSPVFTQQPPSQYLVSDTASDTVIFCRAQSLKSQTDAIMGRAASSSAPSVSIRWRYEELEYVGGDNPPRVIDSGYAGSGATSSLFSDQNDGSVAILARAIEANFFARSLRLPKYRLFCEAALAGPDGRETVVHSRKMVVKKISMLRITQAQILCLSASLGGVAICETKTSPPYTDFFNVTYYKYKVADRTRSQLNYSFYHTKYAIFENGFNFLHILNLANNDQEYLYQAEISLTEGNRIVYRNLSLPIPIKVLPDSASYVAHDQAQVRHTYAAHEVRSGLVVLLPCYQKEAGSLSSRSGVAAQSFYEWRRNGQLIRVSEVPYSEETYAFVTQGVGSLRIRDPRQTDAGVYTCAYRGILLENVTLDLYSRISVKTPASPQIVDFSGNVSLACDAQGWPINSISWLHNGRPVVADGVRIRVTPARESLERGHSVLTIANATLLDQGPYQCFAERFVRPSASKVPYDSAQSSTEVIINKMPPYLVKQRPQDRYIPVRLPGAADDDVAGAAVGSSGSFSCSFTAAPVPKIRITLDGSRTKFDEFESASVKAFVRQTSVSTRRIDVTVNFSPTELQHTGRLVVEARNDFGVAACEFHLFAVASPSLTIRPFEQQSQFAISAKNFSMDCHVLGGLHSGVNLANLTRRHPGLRVSLYDLKWEMRTDSGAVLTLPTNHRTSVDDAEHPDRLRIIDVESTDAGRYTCTATLKHSGAGSNSGPTVRQSESTNLVVVSGIRPSSFSDQLDLEPGVNIGDICKPVNTPTGPWYAWWEFVSSRNGSQSLIKPCSPDIYAQCFQPHVTYLPIIGGSGEQTHCPIANRFVEAGVPQFLLNDHLKRNSEAKMNIRYTEDKPYEGVFTCHLVSCYDSAASHKRVKYKKEYIFKPGHPPNNKEVVLGTSVSVSCQLTDVGPDMPSLLWYKGSKLIKERQVPRYRSLNGTSARVFQFDNGTLRIAEIRPEDQHFLCATDLPDTSKLRSTTFNPSIRYPAQVLPFESNRLELQVGSNHSVPCVVKGDKPYNVSWVARYEGDNNIPCPLIPPDRPRYSSYDYSITRCNPDFVRSPYDATSYQHVRDASITVTEAGVLVLTNVNRGVHGRYICRARNQYNSQRDASADRWPSEQLLDVVVIQRPGPVKNFVSTDHDQTTATLQWEAPDSNGHKEIVRYAIAYTEPTGQLTVQNLTVDKKSHTFTGLQPGTDYVFNITAVNSVGPGPEASCRVSTKERAPSGPVLDLKVNAEGASALRLTWQPPELLKRNGRMTNYSVAVWPVSAASSGSEGVNDCESGTGDVKVTFRCPSTAAFIGPKSDGRLNGPGLGPQICYSEHNPLKAFTEYIVRVTPLNAVGAGPPSCVRVRTLESTPRSPPANPRCEAKTESQILVSWRAPDASSVNGITKEYQIQYMPADDAIEQNETLAEEVIASGTEQLISGLQMYTNYSFTVTVANSKGRSAPTSRIFCRTLAARPEPPRELRAFGVNGTHAVLAWRQTEAPNGRLTGYRIKRVCADSKLEIEHPLPPDGPASHYEHHLIGGLSVNSRCDFSVAARNEKLLGGYSRLESLFVNENPPLQIVSFSQDFRVTQSARLVLDCYIVGFGDTRPKWTMPTVDSPDTQQLPNGSLVVTRLRSIGGAHRYKCSTSDGLTDVSYTVQVASVQNLPVPQTPRLLPGQRTNSSLEVIWRPMGIGSPDSASVPVAAGNSLIASYNLNYVNLYSGAEDTRTVSARNRSYLVDPVQCGAAMKFRIRAVNGFDLKSPYTDYLEMRTLGSRPVLRSGAGPIAKILPRGVEFNFSDILPGDGCHPNKYLVYLHSLPLETLSGFELGTLPPTAVATRDSLDNGCCLKVLDSNLLTGLINRVSSRSGAASLLHFAVVAHNAAGNLTIPGSLKLTGLILRGIGGVGGLGGNSGVGISGPEESRSSWPQPQPDANGVASAGASGSGWLSWPYIVAAGVLALLLVCLFVVCTTVLYRQHKQHSPAVPVDHLQHLQQQQHHQNHHLLPPHQQRLLLQQQQQMYRGNYHQQQQLLQHEKGTRAMHLLAGKQPVAAVPYEDDEDDRESVDSKGNIRAYATFDADGATKPTRGGGAAGGTVKPSTKQLIQQQQQLPPYENDSSTLAGVGAGPYSKGGPQPQAAAGLLQHPASYPGLGLGVRASHMSSVTTLSSNHEELADAYRTQQLMQQLAPMQHSLPAHTAEYEENSGSSETTDPGIRNFTNRPPNPNELRNATCEVPLYQQDDPRSRQQPMPSSRHRRQPSMADSEQTYESIDDVMQRSLTLSGAAGLMKSRTGTLPSVPQPQEFRKSFKNTAGRPGLQQPQQSAAQQRRIPPSEADSYGTGVYEATDSAYNYGTQPGPRHRHGGGGGGGGGSIYNSYRPSQRLYWPDRQQQQPAMPQQQQLGTTREDVEDEIQQLLGGNRLPLDAAAAASQQALPADSNAEADRDSADSTEDDPTYDTRNVTFV